ncbi:HD domain-containing phosphohydrolase [Rhodoferax sp. PAMC 29310]|uniref:HD domain-containing phosphohydrolase n=1 Tax=Rhodoferax sp. PAMC 29310 TaxID=2822760 RepID=UPI001B3434BF|nr:HD domain-containing phosphohydrolase [Rhodoferax sp. PAMC 29310]
MEIFQAAKPTVLILENSDKSLLRIGELLSSRYTVKAVSGGRSVQQVCSDEQPDLVLIDTIRPGNQGFEVCLQLKQADHTRQIPVIFLTREADADQQQLMFDLGAVDYIPRPIHPGTMLARIRAHLADSVVRRDHRAHTDIMNHEALRHSRQLAALQEVTLLALASLAEIRDSETGNHLKRTQHYIFALGQYLRSNPRFTRYLTAERLDIIFKCAPLHDIGKVGIPDKILLKPGRYEEAEYEVMKAHPKLGHDAIVKAQSLVGDQSEFLQIAKEIVYSHHEKWDGSGYPQGLKGDDIPIPARLMAIADVYDALISKRVYKDGMSHQDATQIILAGRGSHFDPDLVDAFVALGGVFQGIASRFADTEEELLEKLKQSELAQ